MADQVKELKKQEVSHEGAIVTVNYPTIGKKHVIDTSEFSAKLHQRAEMHGWEQKFGDAKSGKTPQEKYDHVSRILEALREDKWNVTAIRADNEAIVIEACAKLLKTTVELLTADLDKLDEDKRDEKLSEWAANPKVKLEILEMRQKAAKKAAKDAPEITL